MIICDLHYLESAENSEIQGGCYNIKTKPQAGSDEMTPFIKTKPQAGGDEMTPFIDTSSRFLGGYRGRNIGR